MATNTNVLFGNDASSREIISKNALTTSTQSTEKNKEKIYGEFISQNVPEKFHFFNKKFYSHPTSKADFAFVASGVIFLSAVTGISAIIGFGTTLAATRKQDPKYFHEGVAGVTGVKGVSESGASLALRALGWGSVYAIGGCGILFYGIWKLSGATNAEEFRNKMGSILPRIPKNNPPQSRTEFEGLNDFLTYVSEDWGKNKTKSTK